MSAIRRALTRGATPRLRLGLAALWLGVLTAASACGDDGSWQHNRNENVNLNRPTFPACDPAATMQTVTFVHVNDLHASYNPVAGESPVARIRGFYQSVRADNPYTLFTDAGDDHEKGSVAELLSGGWSTLEVTHALQFDVRVIGNHDFAWGADELLPFSRDPHGIVLASNTEYTGSDPEGFGGVEWAELQVGCLRLGFFGMVSKPWNERNEQYDGDFLPEFHSRYDYVELARDLVSTYRSQVDLVIMVSHLGVSWDETLAHEVDGIQAILGGHTHTTLATPLQVNDTVIIQTGAFAANVGRLDLDVDLGSGEVVDRRYELVPNVQGELTADATVEAAVESTLARWAPGWDQPVGVLATQKTEREVAALAAHAARQVHGVDAALVDVEEVWIGFFAGGVTPQDFLDAFKVERQPADTTGFNSFYEVTLRGADLKALRDAMDSERWVLEMPSPVADGATYTLALQKHAAFNPEVYLPAGVVISSPTALTEAWATLDAYARDRSLQCLHLDENTPVTPCP